MKKYIIPILACLMMSACDYEDVNKNFYGITDDELGPLAYGAPFMEMQQYVIPIGSPTLTTDPGNDLANTDLISSGNYVGYFGNNNNWNFDNEATWNFTEKRMEYAYTNFYSKLFRPWNAIYVKAKDVEEPFDQQVLAMANIVKIAGWLRATDVFGPIVYTNAGKGDIAPTLDSQEEVYKNMLADLSKSVETLNKATENILVEYDAIYNGNVQNWVKFANSLMLRMAVRVHFKDATLAQEYVTKALDLRNGGVIETKSEEAKIESTVKMPLLNSMIASIDYLETRMGTTIWSYFVGYGDPRMDIYFTKGTYRGIVDYYPVAPTNKNAKQTGTDSPEFAAKPNVVPSSPLYWFRASEVYFLKAEAALYHLVAGEARTYYEAGVAMSFTENNVSGASTYLEKTTTASDMTRALYKYDSNYSCLLSAQNTSPKWDHFSTTSSLSQTEQQLQKIITQKYLALYPNAVEAWTEYRRTGYPFIMKPFDAGAPGRIGATSATLAPERFRFAPSEYLLNPNMAQVPTLLEGEDNGATKLWWVRGDRPKQP